MPLLRCTDPECGHEWSERTHLAEDADCEECGAPASPVDAWDDDADQEGAVTEAQRPRVAYARERARQLLDEYGISEVPVQVRALARKRGFSIADRYALGSLRGRLVGDTIELAADDAEVVKRFTIAHEIGHQCLGTSHGSGKAAETEADNFAGELLVPGPKLLAALEETQEVRSLARMFQVSHTALRIAAQQHNKAGLLS